MRHSNGCCRGRYLRARRKEGFISVIAGFSFLGIMLGVATLIIVMAVMNGFRKELLDKILGLNGHLLVQPLESPLTDWKDVAERISQVQGIRLAAPVVDGQALASSPFNAAGVFVRGIRADDLNNLTSIAKNIKQGTLEGFRRRAGRRDRPPARRSIVAACRRQHHAGGAKGRGDADGHHAAHQALQGRGGVRDRHVGIRLRPSCSCRCRRRRPISTAPNDVTAIEVFTTNPDRIDAFRKTVTEAAGRPVFLVDWRQRNSTFFNALQVERNVMFLILTMIVLVAALNIISGLIMLVKDKGSDIAILRTMGASQGSIMRMFLITGASIGVVGTLTGFLVGMLICLNIELIRQFLSWVTNTELFRPDALFLSRLPAEIDFGETTRRGDHGADAVVPGDALPVVARRAPRSRRSAPVRVRGRWREGARRCTGYLSPRDKTSVQAGRGDADDPRRRQARAVGGPVGGAGGAVGLGQIDTAAYRGPAGDARMRARSMSRARRPRSSPTSSAPRSAAPTSASSISRTGCCRNSPRWKTSCCRR